MEISGDRKLYMSWVLIALGQERIITWLLARLAAQPGFADQFEEMTAKIITDGKNTATDHLGVPIEDETEIVGHALRELEKIIADWRRDLRKAERLWPDNPIQGK